MNLLLLNFYISPEHYQVIAVEYVFEKTKKKIIDFVNDAIRELKEQKKEKNKYRIVDHVKDKLKEQHFTVCNLKNVHIDL